MGDAAVELVALETAQIWTDTTGNGDTAVVLCHGGPGLSDNLAPVASMIEDIAVVHRYDQRGGGRSTGDGQFTVSQFVEDLESLRVHWGHASWIVGGHSWGGWLSLMYALEHPARVSAIITIGMPPPPSEGWKASYQHARDSRLTTDEREFFEDIRRRRRTGAPIAEDEEQRWVRLNWRTDFADSSAVPDFSREPLFGFPANYEVNRALVADMETFAATHDLLAELTSIEVAALIVHGNGDPRPAPISAAGALPNARLVRIAGAGHLPWLEQPTEVAQTLRGFVRGANHSSVG